MWNWTDNKDRTLWISEDARGTYGEMGAYVSKIREYLGGENRIVALVASNTPGSLVAYLALMEAGATVMLLPHDRPDDLKEIPDMYEVEDLCAPLGAGAFLHPDLTILDYGLVRLRETREKNPLNKLLLTTSGSTGSPKFVRQSERNVLANAKQIAAYLDIHKEDRPITTLPMHYTYGLSIIHSHVLMGATILLTEKTLFDAGFWEFFKREGATTFGGVPYTYAMLERLRFRTMDLPSLRYLTQAGGHLSADLQKIYVDYAKETGKKFIVMYGQCEATARMSDVPWEEAEEKNGTAGKAIPGGKFSILTDDGETTEPGVIGELIYRGPNVTLGYATSREDLLHGDERHGVLHTGDIATLDADGYIRIVGRKKRFLKIFGNRTNLDEVERKVAKAMEIEVATTGVDDKLILYTVGGEEAKIRAYMNENFSIHPSAIEIRKIEKIPKNEAGKTLYSALPKE